MSLFIFMKRKYNKRNYNNRDKYSIEQTTFLTTSVANWIGYQETGLIDTLQQWFPIVAPSEIQGMRKVKHLTISLSNAGNDAMPLWWCIQYVPAGYEPQKLRISNTGGGTNLVSANQNVMASGVIDFSAGPTRIYSRLARNLNSGDNIYLVLATYSTAPSANQIGGLVQYACTLQ